MKQRSIKSKIGLGLLSAALASGATLASISTSEAASRVSRHRQYRAAPQYYAAPSGAGYNIPSERGYGPAPTGQYRSFEELDHFPGSDNG